MSEMSAPAPEPNRFQAWWNRANADAAIANARALELLRRLDSPWLLLLLLPATFGLGAIGASLPFATVRAALVALAARRWGIGVLVPTLLLCLLELARSPALPGFGNIATIPLLLIAARVGYDPGFLAAVQRCARLSATDYALLAALALVANWQVTAFLPVFEFGADNGTMLALAFLLLGASRVPFRDLGVLLLAGLGFHLLLVPLDWDKPYAGWGFGVWPAEAASCVALFFAARALLAPSGGGGTRARMLLGLWLLLFLCGIFGVQLHYPAAGLKNIAGSTITAYTEPLALPLLLVGMAVLSWRALAGPARVRSVFFGAAIVAGFAAVGFMAVFSSDLGINAWVPRSAEGRGFMLLSQQQGLEQALANALWQALLCIGAILAVERWRPGIVSPAPPAPFMLMLLGRFWASAAGVQAVVVVALAAALAFAGVAPAVNDREPFDLGGNAAAAMEYGPADNSADAAAAAADAAAAAAADAVGAQEPPKPVATDTPIAKPIEPKKRRPRPRPTRTPRPLREAGAIYDEMRDAAEAAKRQQDISAAQQAFPEQRLPRENEPAKRPPTAD